MDDSRLGAVFALCEQHGVPLATHTGWDNPQYNRPHYFAKIVSEHPNLRIVICHLCWPDIDACFEATAAFPNIYYDISSLAHETRKLKKTAKSLRRIAKTHADRIIFGSDYGACSIEAHVALVRSLGLDEQGTQAILAGNALRVYHLNEQMGEPA